MTDRPKSRIEASDADPADPLRAATMQQRIRAAYQQAGFNRMSWAQALDMSYQGAQLIDSGKSMPQLNTLLRMQELIGKYTLDELVFGYNPPAAKRYEPALSNEAVTALLWQVQAEPDTRDALTEFTSSTAGKFVTLTRSYVVAWCERYRTAKLDGMSRPAAIDVARQAADEAQMTTAAIAAQVKPVTPAQLTAASAQLRGKRKRKHSKIAVVTSPPRKRKRA